MKDDQGLGLFFDFLDIAAGNESSKAQFKLKSGERREVCVLFADIKNATALGSKLDPEMFSARIDPLMKRFTKCINYYGGYVDKYMGDGIMALFGARRASEQDTERAVLAGLKMIEQLELYNQKIQGENSTDQVAIQIRIGINTGLAVVGKVGEEREGDFTVIGSTVNLAQRMEANAPVNRILLPVHTRQIVDRFFEFEYFGLVQAKGFDKPVESYTVLRPRLETGQRWLRRKSLFVGRDAELAKLTAAFAHLEHHLQGLDDQHPGISIIGIKGDAGLGKSRLVYELQQAHLGRMTSIACAASGILPSPFNLFINLLENEFHLSASEPLGIRQEKLEAGFDKLSVHLDDAGLDILSDALPLIGMLLQIPYPDPRIRLSGNELFVHIRMALQSLIEIILKTKLEQGKPVVLILDDLHWLDENSATVLGTILQRIFRDEAMDLQDKILVLMQYRQDYTPPESICGYAGFEELELKPLGDIEIKRLIRLNTKDLNLPDELLDKVVKLSNGNPFYLEEWCSFLYEHPSQDLENLPVPPNLHALILSRLDLLETSIRLLLQKAAVIGQEFFVDILSWIEDKLFDPIDVSTTLAKLEHQAFILKLLGFDYSAYFFKHITTRDVAYHTLLLENRKILHRLSAEAIEALYPQRQDEFLYPLAEHYHHADIPDKAIYYLEKAAAACKKNYCNKEALKYYHRLYTWLTQDPGQWKEPEQQLCPPPSIARVLINIAEINSLIGEWDETETTLQEAFGEANRTTAQKDIFDCLRLRGILAFRKGKMDQALADWESGLSTAQELDKADSSNETKLLLAIAHGNLGIWYQHHKQTEPALEHHRKSLDYARTTNSQIQIAKTLSNLGFYSINLGNYLEAETLLNQCLEICREERLLQLESIALGNLGYLYHKQGKLDNARPYFEQKWLLVDKLDDMAERIKVLGNIGNIHRDKGEHREALEYYRRVLELKTRLGNKQELAITHCAIADELAEIGQIQEAITQIEQAIEYSMDNPKKQCEYIYYQATYHLQAGDSEQALNQCQMALVMAQESARTQVANLCEELKTKLTK